MNLVKKLSNAGAGILTAGLLSGCTTADWTLFSENPEEFFNRKSENVLKTGIGEDGHRNLKEFIGTEEYHSNKNSPRSQDKSYSNGGKTEYSFAHTGWYGSNPKSCEVSDFRRVDLIETSLHTEVVFMTVQDRRYIGCTPVLNLVDEQGDSVKVRGEVMDGDLGNVRVYTYKMKDNHLGGKCEAIFQLESPNGSLVDNGRIFDRYTVTIAN
jgi:hypothetical protein